MDHCTVFCHQPVNAELTALMKEYFPSDTLKIEREIDFTIFTIKQKGSLFSREKIMTVKYRERERPSYQLTNEKCALERNLMGMHEFVSSIKAQNTTVHSQLLQKIEVVNSEIVFTGFPNYTNEIKSILHSVCEEYDPIIFAEPGKFFNHSKKQQFLNKDLKLILDVRGVTGVEEIKVDIDQKFLNDNVKISPLAKRRKEASNSLLEAKGVLIDSNLHFSLEHTKLKSESALIHRAYALAITTARGEGIPTKKLDVAIEKLKITEFSDFELDLLKSENLTESQKRNAAWRYESLNVILWALGRIEILEFPIAICNVQLVANLILKEDRELFTQNCKMKNLDEILDQLDFTFRAYCATVEAAKTNKESPGGIINSVVYERLYALYWITNFQDKKWDEIEVK